MARVRTHGSRIAAAGRGCPHGLACARNIMRTLRSPRRQCANSRRAPWPLATSAAMARPRPKPSPSCVARQNGASTIRPLRPRGMPGPSSAISATTLVAILPDADSEACVRAPCWTALSMMLRSASRRVSGIAADHARGFARQIERRPRCRGPWRREWHRWRPSVSTSRRSRRSASRSGRGGSPASGSATG